MATIKISLGYKYLASDRAGPGKANRKTVDRKRRYYRQLTGAWNKQSHITKLKHLAILFYFSLLNRTYFNLVQQISHVAYWTRAYYSPLKAEALNHGIEIFHFKTKHRNNKPLQLQRILKPGSERCMQKNIPDLQIIKSKSQQPPSQKSLFKGVPKGFLSSHSVAAGLHNKIVCVMPLLSLKKPCKSIPLWIHKIE